MQQIAFLNCACYSSNTSAICQKFEQCYWDGVSKCLPVLGITCYQIKEKNACENSLQASKSCSWCDSSSECLELESFFKCVVCDEISEKVWLFKFFFLHYFLFRVIARSKANIVNIVLLKWNAWEKMKIVNLVQDYKWDNALLVWKIKL